MARRDEPMRNLDVQKAAARRDAAEAKATAVPEAKDKVDVSIDNEALTMAVRATLAQRKSKKRPAATTPPPEPDRSLDQLMVTYGKSKPRHTKTTPDES